MLASVPELWPVHQLFGPRQNPKWNTVCNSPAIYVWTTHLKQTRWLRGMCRYRWCSRTDCSVNYSMMDTLLPCLVQKTKMQKKIQKKTLNNKEHPLHSTFKLANRSGVTAAWGQTLINIMIWGSKDSHNLSCAIQATINTAVDMTHQLRRMMCSKGRSSQSLQTVNCHSAACQKTLKFFKGLHLDLEIEKHSEQSRRITRIDV